MNYWLICTILTSDTTKTTEALTSTGFATDRLQIKFSWRIETENPTTLKLHSNSSKLGDDVYKCLAGTYTSV